jgi:hypothetical protein
MKRKIRVQEWNDSKAVDEFLGKLDHAKRATFKQVVSQWIRQIRS